ncbi:MAG: 3-dehydroquinate synthase [Candidatus Omnitrophica bacterium]|nr:3-dehydroquinate synthase [Candidatus Omnitrophota bacterium]
MKTITVNLKEHSYNIFVGHGLLQNISNLIPAKYDKNPILIVTNPTVAKLHGEDLVKSLKRPKDEIHIIQIRDSERSKSFETYKRIIDDLQKIGQKTKPLLLAFGGGVVGDVSGFAAATYRRGIPYVQIPTTLLAQVDSSIGGKVAIDLPEAKNLVGAFYQPKAVICDLDVLKTLPLAEIKNGMGEIIKYALLYKNVKDINVGNLFADISDNLTNMFELKKECIETIVAKCAQIKAKVVELDEFDEKDKRIILNLGHTFAHAVESYFQYSKKYTHGECVALGMILASRVSLKMGKISNIKVVQIVEAIKRSGLLSVMPKGISSEIIKIMDYDKKFIDGKTRFVLPNDIGKVYVDETVPIDVIKQVIIESEK